MKAGAVHESSVRAERLFRLDCLEPDSARFEQTRRYLSRGRLDNVLRDLLREEAARRGLPTSLTAPALRRYLEELALVVRLTEAEDAPKDALYWLTLRGRSGLEHDPIEVLGAFSEHGVVAHASALVFHGLTQLRVTQHFVVVPTTRQPRRTGVVPPLRPQDDQALVPREKPPVPRTGRLVARLAGVEYRMRETFEDLLFGVVEAPYGDKGSIRVFDRERALLHTLTDPACNGGQRGVLDAWEFAVERLRVDRLLAYLKRLDEPTIWRRIGALSEHLELTDVTAAAAEAIAAGVDTTERVDMVRGVVGRRLIFPWNVMAPW